jgi:hypothetical protein
MRTGAPEKTEANYMLTEAKKNNRKNYMRTNLDVPKNNRKKNYMRTGAPATKNPDKAI